MGHGIDALHRLTATFVVHSVNCLNTFWFRSKPATPSVSLQADCDSIVSDFTSIIWPKYQAFCSTELQLIGLVATTLNPIGQAQTVSFPVGQFGTVGGDCLPSYCAAVLSLYTAYPGRRVHGRLYIPGVPEASHSGSILTVAAGANLALLGDVLRTQYGEAGSNSKYWLSVYSRKNGNGLSSTIPPFITYSPLAAIPLKRTVANARLGTNRHRKLGRGI